ncbi:MAG: protease PrsW, partial [Chloroflexi bacterium]|nr:protease PrsW [Chloroflexota bacterium]
GIGLATARLTKNFAIKIIAPLIGWMIAVAFHAAHNTLVLSLRGIGALIAFPLDWLGWLIIFGVMMWAIRREQNWLVKHLKGEIELGTINAAHYRIATSIFGRTGAWLNAIARGRVTVTRKFYQRCAELAFKKEQLENFGDEGGNASRISNLRAEIARLAPQVS